MSKYIKVTEKGRLSVVVLATNRAFFTSRGAVIEDPTPEEIAFFYPEEKRQGNSHEPAEEPIATKVKRKAAKSASGGFQKQISKHSNNK